MWKKLVEKVSRMNTVLSSQKGKIISQIIEVLTWTRCVRCAINRCVSWGHQSGSEGLTFLPLLFLQSFSAIFFFASFPPRITAAPGMAEQSNTGTKLPPGCPWTGTISFSATEVHLLVIAQANNPRGLTTSRKVKATKEKWVRSPNSACCSAEVTLTFGAAGAAC